MSTSEGDVINAVLWLQHWLDFSRFGGQVGRKYRPEIDPRWDASRHRSFSDFGQFLEPCWAANRAKINPKRYRKNDAKRKGAKFGKMVAALRYPARRGLGVGSTWARRGLGVGSAPAGTRARRRWGGKKTCICDLTRRRPEARRIY